MSEKLVQSAILSYLEMRGHFVWRNNSAFIKSEYVNRYGQKKTRAFRAGVPGSSDILGVEKGTGRFIAIEVKYGKNKPTDDQERFLAEVKSRGGIAIVAYSLDEVTAVL
jgi:hypothetical protein